MLFERFEDAGLSQYSYAVGCEGTGTLAIVDPRRDVDVYLDFAATRGMRIGHIFETHIHADFASGARELAERAGAELWLSAYDAGEVYEAKFPHRELQDGQAVEIGRVRITALHTPGHTPEHLSFLVHDGARSREVPQLLLSGDFIFIGSLGRPDLIGEEAKVHLANLLYDSVQKTAGLPDSLEVHPGHGAGSMCGAGMSARPMSTLGFERIANPYLIRGLAREAFVSRILSGLPPFPPYYRRMKVLNSSGPPLLHGLPGHRALAPAAFKALVDSGHVVVDLRDQLAFGAGHIAGSFGLATGHRLSTWASWLVPYDKPIMLVATHPQQVDEAVRALVRVGLDDVRGYLEGGMAAWITAGHATARTPQVTPLELGRSLAADPSVVVLDVRNADEWKAGHVEGACHIMGGHLADRLDEVPRDGRMVAVICATGYRSTAITSVLERAGYPHVVNVTGGITAWQHAGLPVVSEPAPAPAS